MNTASTNDHVGSLVRELRQSRSLSLSGLAKAAGVAKSTISYWESGTRTPSIPELELVLDSLEATPSQKATAIRSLNAPRGIQRLRGLVQGEPPVGGDLLRAMRLRQGWGQDRLAKAVGVGQSTVAKWERGELWPAPETLQIVCFVLRAHEDEIASITRGRFLEAQGITATDYQACIDRFWIAMYYSRPELRDLLYLSLEADLWIQAERHKWAKPLLCEVYSRHAQFLTEHERFREADSISLTAMNLSFAVGGAPDRFTPAVVARAKSAIQVGKSRPTRAIDLIDPWYREVKLPEYRAWLLVEMAIYHSMRNHRDEANELYQAACDQASLCWNADELANRRIDYAHWLVRDGRPNEALELLPEIEDPSGANKFMEAFVHGHVSLGLGRREEAAAWAIRLREISADSGNVREQRLANSFVA